MKLVLDTSALWHRPLMEAIHDARLSGALDDGRLTVILPTLAYAERLRQLRRDGRDPEAWKERAHEVGLAFETFGEVQAESLPSVALDDSAWRRHARDVLILAHVSMDREVVTADEAAIWKVRRLSPDAAARAIRDILRV